MNATKIKLDWFATYSFKPVVKTVFRLETSNKARTINLKEHHASKHERMATQSQSTVERISWR